MASQTPKPASLWTSAQLLNLSQTLGEAYGANPSETVPTATNSPRWTLQKLLKMSAAKSL